MRWVLEHIDPTIAIGIDPYVAPKPRLQPAYLEHKAAMLHNLHPWLVTGKVEVWYLSSRHALRRDGLEDHSFDLIFIDGDHHASNALLDICFAWPLLKIGGILVMDDYNRRWHLGRPWTHEAIDAFLMGFEKYYDLLWGAPKDNRTKQIAVRKLKK
jgi:predicted O-methyltransferase YrrM